MRPPTLGDKIIDFDDMEDSDQASSLNNFHTDKDGFKLPQKAGSLMKKTRSNQSGKSSAALPITTLKDPPIARKNISWISDLKR